MNQRLRPFPTLLLFVALLLPLGALAYAEELYSDSGFFLELPEGFTMNDGDGISNFSFTDPSRVILFQILLYEPSRYPDAKSIAGDIARKLSARADSVPFIYQRRDAVLAQLSFQLNGSPHKGWALFLNGAAKGASGLAEKDIALLAYAPEEHYEACLPFLFSCLDSFSIDEEARFYPGPISQFNLPWNPGARKPGEVRFGGSILSVPVDPREGSAAQDTVEREYLVLAAYEKAPAELALAAWKRFYRMVFRETYHRLDYLALALSREISGEPDPRARAARLLKWTQGFIYERDPKGSDVLNPLTAGLEGRGDCDSRALLLAILARHDNEDALLLLSQKHSHALAAFDVSGPGARFSYNGKGWLIGETTDHVDIGLIDSTMANPADWLAVEFPR